MDEAEDDPSLIASNEEWALVRPQKSITSPEGDQGGLAFFLLWLAEEDMPQNVLTACHQMNQDPPKWQGVQLDFKPLPSPGFAIGFQKGWAPASTSQQKDLFAKMIWEIERAKGKQ